MQELITQLRAYVSDIWRHRWQALAACWLVCLIGWIAVHMMPSKYEADARVFVDTDTMLKPLLSGLAVQPNLEQKVTMMSRTLITRPNLEKVMQMTDMDIRAKSVSEQEAYVDMLARKITLKSIGKDNLFTVSYTDTDPHLAKKVVEAMLNLFVESSLGDKRKDTENARRFIDTQIKAYEEKLITAENALKEFKQKNIGLMPDAGRDFFARMTEAGARINQARLELRELENARDAIKQQLVGEEPVFITDAEPEIIAAPGVGGEQAYANPELESRIQSLKKNLDSLRLKYTEQHPDIIATKRIIAELETQKAQEAKEAMAAMEASRREERAALEVQLAEAAKTGKRVDAGAMLNQNPVFQQLKASLADTEARAAAARARVQEYELRFEELKGQANQVHQIEADLKQLSRDYEVNRANYEALLARRESAQISDEMQSSAGGLNFRIIDPPRVPLHPSAPNRPLLASLVLVLGLGAGVVFALAMSQIRPTVNEARGLRELTGLPVLGSISVALTPARRRREFLGMMGYGATCTALIACYLAVLGFYYFTAKPVVA